MLDRVKAKRDAIDKEIDLHQRAIECLKKKLVVYDEIIEEEEALVSAAPEEDIKANEEEDEGLASSRISYAD